MQILDGKQTAADIRTELKWEIASLLEETGRPGFRLRERERTELRPRAGHGPPLEGIRLRAVRVQQVRPQEGVEFGRRGRVRDDLRLDADVAEGPPLEVGELPVVVHHDDPCHYCGVCDGPIKTRLSATDARRTVARR